MNAVEKAAIALQRVWTAHGFITLDEFFIDAIKEENPVRKATLTQLIQRHCQFRELSGTNIDDDGEPPHSTLGRQKSRQGSK